MTARKTPNRLKPTPVYRLSWTTAVSAGSTLFKSEKTANLAMLRTQANPAVTTAHITMDPVHPAAPPADFISAAITPEGAVSELQGPYANVTADRSVRLAVHGHLPGTLAYTGPSRTRTQARRELTALRSQLQKANMWPQSSSALTLLQWHYVGLPWWLQRPPPPPEPGRVAALHGLLLCSICSRFLEQDTQDEQLFYSCPNSGPDHAPACPSSRIPAEKAKWTVIACLRHRFVREETSPALARQLQGHSTDPAYHRSLTREILEQDSEIHETIQKHSLPRKHNHSTEDHQRDDVRAALTEGLGAGTNPLNTLIELQNAGNAHAALEIIRLIPTLLARQDTSGAAAWLKQHLRCASLVPGHEEVHYTREAGPDRILWERADDTSYSDRIMNDIRNGPDPTTEE